VAAVPSSQAGNHSRYQWVPFGSRVLLLLHVRPATGRRRGTEIVQLYPADTATGVTLPAQQLVGFAGVDLEPGPSKSVAVTGTTRVIKGEDRASFSVATVGS
jgi:fibronectin type III domain protein